MRYASLFELERQYAEEDLSQNNDQQLSHNTIRPKNEPEEKKKKSKRGLASASIETRRRVASLGGKASHGGGRPPGSTNK